jgi:hypothetical protein
MSKLHIFVITNLANMNSQYSSSQNYVINKIDFWSKSYDLRIYNYSGSVVVE